MSFVREYTARVLRATYMKVRCTESIRYLVGDFEGSWEPVRGYPVGGSPVVAYRRSSSLHPRSAASVVPQYIVEVQLSHTAGVHSSVAS